MYSENKNVAVFVKKYTKFHDEVKSFRDFSLMKKYNSILANLIKVAYEIEDPYCNSPYEVLNEYLSILSDIHYFFVDNFQGSNSEKEHAYLILLDNEYERTEHALFIVKQLREENEKKKKQNEKEEIQRRKKKKKEEMKELRKKENFTRKYLNTFETIPQLSFFSEIEEEFTEAYELYICCQNKLNPAMIEIFDNTFLRLIKTIQSFEKITVEDAMYILNFVNY